MRAFNGSCVAWQDGEIEFEQREAARRGAAIRGLRQQMRAIGRAHAKRGEWCLAMKVLGVVRCGWVNLELENPLSDDTDDAPGKPPF